MRRRRRLGYYILEVRAEKTSSLVPEGEQDKIVFADVKAFNPHLCSLCVVSLGAHPVRLSPISLDAKHTSLAPSDGISTLTMFTMYCYAHRRTFSYNGDATITFKSPGTRCSSGRLPRPTPTFRSMSPWQCWDSPSGRAGAIWPSVALHPPAAHPGTCELPWSRTLA